MDHLYLNNNDVGWILIYYTGKDLTTITILIRNKDLTYTHFYREGTTEPVD